MALKQLADRITSILLVCVLTGIFAVLSYFMVTAVQEPFRVLSLEVMNPVLKPGEPLTIKYVSQRNKHCVTSTAQFFVDLGNGETVYRARVPAGHTDIGVNTNLLSIPLPFKAIPGKIYAYRPVVESECGISTFAYRVPDAVFQVVP